MTTTSIKKVDCKDFQLAILDSGKQSCQHYIKGNLCDIPRNLICRPALLALKDNDRLLVGSYSQLSLFAQCHRKYFYQYILNIKPLKVPSYYIQGRIFHEKLAHYYSTGDIAPRMIQDEDQAKAEAMAESYIEYYHDYEPGLEVEVSTIIEPQPNYLPRQYKAILDLYKKSTDEIIDHKFSGQIQPFLTSAFQAVFYFTAKPEAKKFTVNTTLKPGQKRKKDESINEFFDRIKQTVAKEPGSYFSRISFYRSEVMDRFLAESSAIELDLVSRLELKHLHYWPMNPSACFMMECEYQSICNNGSVDKKLYKITPYRSKTNAK